MNKSITSFKTAAIAGAVLLVGVSACSNVSQEAQRDDSGKVTETEVVSIFALSKGDCFNEVSPTGEEIVEFNSVEVTPCTEPHVGQIFHEASLPDGEFPGTDAISEFVLEECDTKFMELIENFPDEEQLTYWSLEPTEQSWNEVDDRLVQCVGANFDDSVMTFDMLG